MHYTILFSFIDKYGKSNPNLLQQLREAVRLKPDQLLILGNMASYTKQYCPDKHILELLFDLRKNINCEKLIRFALGEKDAEEYSLYIQEISGPFQKLFDDDWNQMTKVLFNLKLDTHISIDQKTSLQKKRWPKYMLKLLKQKKENGTASVNPPPNDKANLHTHNQKNQVVTNHGKQNTVNQNKSPKEAE